MSYLIICVDGSSASSRKEKNNLLYSIQSTLSPITVNKIYFNFSPRFFKLKINNIKDGKIT